MTTTDQRQDAELDAHTHRLDDLEDRLSVTFPAPDTPAGAAQRIRLEVPSPASVMTIGARGSATMDGRPIGPGGVAIHTVENLAAQILSDTILDTAGVTTLYSDGPARMLTLEDLGLSGDEGVRVGTQNGDVEITAGRVGTHDPSFTTIPSMDIPPVAVVDTAGPRGATETSRAVWDGVWTGTTIATTLQDLYCWFVDWLDPPGGYSPPSIEPHAASVIRQALTAVGRFRSMVVPAISTAVSAASSAQGEFESEDPKVHIHGVGGVEVSSPVKVRLFGVGAAKVESPKGATLAGGVSAAVKSPVSAKVYGGLMVALKSQVIAKISARYAVMSGDYVELKGKAAAAISSAHNVTVTAGERVALDAPFVVIGGRSNVDVSAQDFVRISARREVDVRARERIRSAVEGSQVTIEREKVQLHVGNCDVDVEDKITLKAGTTDLTVESGRVTIGQRFSLTDREMVMRGTVRLG